MRLKLEQLESHLAKSLAPIYFLTGDEPLQQQEAADAVRRAARQAGHSEREILEVEGQFDWRRLGDAADSPSLFAERRLLELRMAKAKPGQNGSKAIIAYCKRPADDALLLITAPKLEAKDRQAAWVKALEKAGVVIQIWPPAAAQLPTWLERRMRRHGLHPASGVAKLLAEHCEGNLLAAEQAIQMLQLLHSDGTVDRGAMMAVLSNSSRYNAFDLVDAALSGDPARCVRIIDALEGEGVAPLLPLATLAIEIRRLAAWCSAREKGNRGEEALNSAGVRANRHAIYQRAGQRFSANGWRAMIGECAKIDAIAKGQAAGDPWQALLRLSLAISGKELFPHMALAGFQRT